MKIIEVEICEKCPYAYHVWANQYFCKEPKAQRRTIPDGRILDKDCTLKDLKEAMK